MEMSFEVAQFLWPLPNLVTQPWFLRDFLAYPSFSTLVYSLFTPSLPPPSINPVYPPLFYPFFYPTDAVTDRVSLIAHGVL
jgi:hypothetical protein